VVFLFSGSVGIYLFPMFVLFLEYQVTLVGGVVDTNGHMSNGQVAVTKNNITGSICFNEWNANIAVVVCRMLGYK